MRKIEAYKHEDFFQVQALVLGDLFQGKCAYLAPNLYNCSTKSADGQIVIGGVDGTIIVFDDLSNSPESRDSAKPIHKWPGNIAKITSFEWNSTTWLLILYSQGL